MATSPSAGINSFTAKSTYTGAAEVRPLYNNTDVLFQQTKVYVEGVEVPFISASVSQVYGDMPTATLDLLPESGLLDITRGYRPKVMIFYEDRIAGGMRLLFWGSITGSSYSRGRDPANTYISFTCTHKNNLVKSALMDYAGWTQPNSTDIQDSEGAVRIGNFNSQETVVEALRGINAVAADAKDIVTPDSTTLATSDSAMLDPSVKDHLDRLIGVPGCAVNLWNQYKKHAYLSSGMNLNVSSMMAPLIEEGLSFFKRMSGHYLLEKVLQDSKEAYCNERGVEKKCVVPPAFQNPLLSALKSELAANVIRTQLGNSGEYTDYMTLLSSFLTSIYYDIVTLASPCEVSLSPLAEARLPDDGYSGKTRSVVETVIKPHLPFYYSPVCNVLLPRMYSNVTFQQDESAVPTRMLAYHSVDNSGTSNVLFRSPPTVRESTAYGALLKSKEFSSSPLLDLKDTMGVSFNVPGKYEQGTGIRPSKTALPWWLSTLGSGQAGRGTPSEAVPKKGTPEYDAVMTLSAAWDDRYSRDTAQEPAPGADTRPINPEKRRLNPYNIEAPTISAFQRVLLSALDYEYAKTVAGARSGNVEALFNPYIVPGYPMDIIDDSPNHPCLHALCVSVTHSLTPDSANTNVGIAAVMTYAELSNFYLPPIHPCIQTTLNIINATAPSKDPASDGDSSGYTDIKTTILQNPQAKATADEFYLSVFGVGAAAPDDLFDFKSGRVNGLSRLNGNLIPTGIHQAEKSASLPSVNGGELNDYLSSVGNLRLVHRFIETKTSISNKFDYTFIDLSPENYNESVVQYVPPISASGLLLEPGASLFLDYLETKDFINLSKKRTS